MAEEQAMQARFSVRIEQALKKLQARIGKSQKRLHRDASIARSAPAAT